MNEQMLAFVKSNVSEIRIGKEFTTVCVRINDHQDRCFRVKGKDTLEDAVAKAMTYLESEAKEEVKEELAKEAVPLESSSKNDQYFELPNTLIVQQQSIA